MGAGGGTCTIEHSDGAAYVIVPYCGAMRCAARAETAARSQTLPRVLVRRDQTMKSLKTMALIGTLIAFGAVPVVGQVHKFFSPGTVWTVTMIKMAPGM